MQQDKNNPFSSLIESHKNEFQYLNKNDRRMRFNNARDPIYFAFDYIENRPVKDLAVEFVKDSVFEITKFVSKVVK